MPKVTAVDHLSITVSNFKKSRQFYDGLMKFLGFKVLDEYEDSMGWTNGQTRLWITQAEKRHLKSKHHFGDVGFHHYAYRLGSKKEVDELQIYLKKVGAKIVDPAGEYYDKYYAVYFTDPDGMKFEGMWYG